MNDNSGRRDYTLGHRIEGFARPASKKFTPNLAHREHVLSDSDGRWSTVVTVSIKPATQQWPAPAVNVQMSNGNGSAFQRIGGIQELRDFASAILVTCDTLEPIWTVALSEGKILEAAQDQVRVNMDMIREMVASQEPEQPPQEWESNN